MLKTLIASIAFAFAAATPAFATIDWQWQFDSAANPASPQIAGGLGATATINVDPIYGTGWHNNDWGLGSATGFWDLGQNGSVVLTIPGFASPSQTLNATLKIVQWVDDFLYYGNLNYLIPGATQVSSTTPNPIETTFFGSWVEYETVWTLLASSDPTVITITGPETGAIFSGITARITVVPEPTTVIAGALLLLPFAASTLRVLRRKTVG